MNIPKLRRHRRGTGTARLSGQDHYFGPWPDADGPAPAAVQELYEQTVARWIANGRKPLPRGPDPGVLTVADLAARYVDYLRADCPAGSREPVQVELACRPLLRLAGADPAREFDANRLEEVRAEMVRAGWARSHANRCTARVRRMFRWAGRKKHVPAGVYADLATLEPLRKGQRGVREAAKRRSATADVVAAVCRQLSAPMAAMVRLCWLTGMRPGEVRRLALADLDRSGEEWVYRPAAHKGAWRGDERAVALGPDARAVLAPWLALPGADAGPVFNPRRLMWAYHAAGIAARAGEALTATQAFALTWFKRVPGRMLSSSGDEYTASGFEASVGRSAEAAGFPWFSCYCTRHGFKMRAAALGPEAVKAAMGHASVDTQALYGERDLELAKEVARKIG